MTTLPLDWDQIRTRRAEVPQHVVFRELVSETVLLNIDTGQYHGMDETGSRFFEVLRDCDSLESAVTTLVSEFEAPREQIRDDLIGYCSELVTRGLIELHEPGARA